MEIKDVAKFNNYFWIGRVFPALICLLPFFIFQYFYLGNLMITQLKIVEQYSLFLNVMVISLSIYVSSILVRSLGKDLIEHLYFTKNNKFPTTQILMRKRVVISEQQLHNLKIKIKKDFKINLFKKIRTNELLLRVNDAVDQIRAKVGYNKKILNQYNAEYGFFRNLTGGMIIYFLSDLLLIIFSYSARDFIVFKFSLILLVIGFLFVTSSYYILERYGLRYAKNLFDQYLILR